MSQLYEKTKELIDLIKQVRPEIEIESDYIYGIKNDMITTWNKEVINYLPSYPSSYRPKELCDVLDSDTLLHLIPQLFEGVDGPEYVIKTLDPKNYIANPSNDVKIRLVDSSKQDTLARALLQKYFVDGLWVESQEAVLEDIIDNVKKYLIK